MLLKRRHGHKLTKDEKTSASDKALFGLKKYLATSTTDSNNSMKSEQPEDILADCSIFRQESPPIWKRKRFHFIIGVSMGLLAAYGASTTPVAQTHLNDLQSYLSFQLAEMDFLAKMLPMNDIVDDIFGNFTNFFMPIPATDQAFMPALTYKEELDLQPHFPVVLIPGVISSGLESWGTLEKSRKFFRKRLWGTTTMLRSVLLDKELWIEHLKLDSVTGLDPPGIKIRAAQGLDAADYFITGYWIWAKIIENLAHIGYDNNNMYLASYDWRLSFRNLEIRDKYFSKLKSIMEVSKATTHVPAVVVTHSMGSTMFPYFLKWVQSPEGGNGGEDWTERHIASFVNVAGPMLGVPKALAALLSGETRDTMSLGSFGAYLLEKFFSRRERAELLRTWGGSGASMLPKGGELFWGNRDQAPDDELDTRYHSYGNIISFTKTNEDEATVFEKDVKNRTLEKMIDKDDTQNFNVDDSMRLLLNQSANAEFTKMLEGNYSFAFTTSKKQLKKNNLDQRKWANPLESQLPYAPSMKIYCFYGVGLPTERSYYYTRAKDDIIKKNHGECCDADCTIDTLFNETNIKNEDFMKAVVEKSIKEDSKRETNNTSPTTPIYIDRAMHDPSRGVERGVRFSDGDGTVPVLSLGYMCAPSGGWTKHASLYNPGRSPVVLKEYAHELSDSKLDVRGGSKAGDHVDILGNWEMTLDILLIASNRGQDVKQRILSNIEKYTEKVNTAFKL